MGYIDGYVLPVRRDRIDDYRKIAKTLLAIWIEHGALSAVEAVADDVPDGAVTSFPLSVKASPHETVVFAFITYRDRAHRDEVRAKAAADPRMQQPDARIVDGERMIWGGFRCLVSMGAA